MKVNICGIEHEVKECTDYFNGDLHLGQIDYGECVIKMKQETLCHEMTHGILMHLGYDDLSNDEHFVQALGNAIYQGFTVKENK